MAVEEAPEGKGMISGGAALGGPSGFRATSSAVGSATSAGPARGPAGFDLGMMDDWLVIPVSENLPRDAGRSAGLEDVSLFCELSPAYDGPGGDPADVPGPSTVRFDVPWFQSKPSPGGVHFEVSVPAGVLPQMTPTAGAADESVEDPGMARIIQCWYDLQQALEGNLRDGAVYRAEFERMHVVEAEAARVQASYDHDAEVWDREQSDFIERERLMSMSLSEKEEDLQAHEEVDWVNAEASEHMAWEIGRLKELVVAAHMERASAVAPHFKQEVCRRINLSYGDGYPDAMTRARIPLADPIWMDTYFPYPQYAPDLSPCSRCRPAPQASVEALPMSTFIRNQTCDH